MTDLNFKHKTNIVPLLIVSEVNEYSLLCCTITPNERTLEQNPVVLRREITTIEDGKEIVSQTLQ